jgi:hypothetical protein
MDAAVNRYKDIQSSGARAESGQTSYQTGRYFPCARFSPGVIELTVEPEMHYGKFYVEGSLHVEVLWWVTLNNAKVDVKNSDLTLIYICR